MLTLSRAVLSLLLLGSIAHGRLVINEIMIHPTTVPERGRWSNWFEIYNTEATTVFLNGWDIVPCHVGYDMCTSYRIETTKSIGPFGFFIIGNNWNEETNGGIPLDVDIPFIRYPNNGANGFFELRRPSSSGTPGTGTVEDLVTWDTVRPTVVYPGLPFGPGHSLAKVNARGLASDVTNWKQSQVPIGCTEALPSDRGTPGKVNTFQCPTDSPTPSPTAPDCGLLRLNIMCLNGCGIFGRLFGLCYN